MSLATLLFAMSASALAVTTEYTDEASFVADAGTTVTADFTGYNDGTVITTQYAGIGATFTDADDVVLNAAGTFADDYGLNLNGTGTVDFATPQTVIAFRYPGALQLTLLDSGGVVVWDSSNFGASGTNLFAGIITDTPFSTVIIDDYADGAAYIGDMIFGDSPGPSIQEYTDSAAFDAAAGLTDVIDFLGFNDGTLITDQYAYLDAEFTDGDDAVANDAGTYLRDGAGSNLNGTATVLFEEPRTAVGIHYPGALTISLLDINGNVFYTSAQFGSSGTGLFGGITSATPFYGIVIDDPVDGNAYIDDILLSACSDLDADGICDVGGGTCGDADGDGVCDSADLCWGDDSFGDSDFDGACDLVLSTGRPISGSTMTLTARGAAVGQNVVFLGSGRGLGTSCHPSGLVCSSLRAPRVLGSGIADASGTATYSVFLPPSLPIGFNIYLQAAWLDQALMLGEASNVAIVTVQP